MGYICICFVCTGQTVQRARQQPRTAILPKVRDRATFFFFFSVFICSDEFEGGKRFDRCRKRNEDKWSHHFKLPPGRLCILFFLSVFGGQYRGVIMNVLDVFFSLTWVSCIFSMFRCRRRFGSVIWEGTSLGQIGSVAHPL